MPTYEYECKSCKASFEIFQSMSDAPVKVCPECGKEVRRIINGGSGIIFKGSGFYVTDKSKNAAIVSPKTDKTGDKAGEKKSTDSSGTSANPAASTEKAAPKEKPASGEKTKSGNGPASA